MPKLRLLALPVLLPILLFPSASAAETPRTKDKLQVLYDFSETSGSTIFDRSGSASPLNLTIHKPQAVERKDGALIFRSHTLISSGGPSFELTDSIRKANALTLEAWIKPASESQNGPARILTLSLDSNLRNFTLGQQGDRYDVRLRTSNTSSNGIPSLTSSSGLSRRMLTHIVYSRDSSGTARLYLDGRQQAEKKLGGNLESWKREFRLGLGNELTQDRPWLGELHLVAIYSKALSPQEVAQNFAAGAGAAVQSPAPAASTPKVAVRDQTASLAQSARPSGPGVFEIPGLPPVRNQIDKLVFAKLSKLGIKPALCSDAVFVRRAYLDVIGILPTAGEARQFIEDSDKNKRAALIDRLLERHEFADYWAMRWGDVLRIKAEFPVNLWPNAAQAYHRWVRDSIAENKLYTQFVREMLTSSGSNFRVGPVNFYRAIQNRTPEGITGAVALTFMGSRIDNWPEDRVAGTAAFFSQIGYKATSEWKEQTVFWDPLGSSAASASNAPGVDAIEKALEVTNEVLKEPAELPASPPAQTGVFPDGKKVKLPPGRDPRKIFADWLIDPKNPWFTRSIANRVWAWLMGRGIIHEPDDIRPDNPPSNPELLAHLEKELIRSNYNLKEYYRLILNSSAYQLSAVPKSSDPVAEEHFASYAVRRLDAEVLIDAINKVTGTVELYTSAIPEPYTYIPSERSAVAIADGSITSTFLTLFGRTARTTGMESERTNKVLPSQWLYILNSSHIQGKIDQGPKLQEIITARRKPEETIEELYLTILSRFPTAEEIKHIETYGKPGLTAKRREDWVDIIWSLVNSSEFLFRH